MSASRVTDAESKKWFRVTCLFEISLLAVAGVIAMFTKSSLSENFHWRIQDVLIAAGASLPPFLLFVRSLCSTRKPTVEIRLALERTLGRTFRNFSMLQLAVVSVLAGVCEEVLFRAVVQRGLAESFGAGVGLLASACLFGLAHSITPFYALVTGVAGFYLGTLWMLTGNLLTPIFAHALYDFLALVYFLRRHQASQTNS